MPITKELENIRKFESVGFSHEQAETLTDVIEHAIVDGQQSLKESISDLLDEKFKTLDDKFKAIDDRFKDVRNDFKDVRNEITASELRIKASHTDLLIKILAIAAGCTTIGIAISKAWK